MSPDREGKPDVVVVGSLNMDLAVRTRRLPARGETVLGEDFAMLPGGKGGNQAVSAARQGARVTMIGAVGADAMGDRLRAALAAEGVDVGGVRQVCGQPSGVALIAVDQEGDNTIVVAPGANAAVSPEHVRVQAALVTDVRVVLTQLEIPLPAVRAALEAGRAAGAWTILDPAPACDLDDEILGLVDVITPNETEAEALTGISVVDDEGAERASQALLARGCGAVLITLADKGARYRDRTGTTIVPACAVDALDATAAGDAFCGALAAALASGTEMPAALRRAGAAGALAATVVGASSSLPTVDAVDALLVRDSGNDDGEMHVWS